MYSTKFSVSIHILSVIALSSGTPVTSDYIASSINTNSALVRRLMSALKKAGLIHAQTRLGATGLAKPAESISLKSVFQAVEKKQRLFAIHEDTNQECPVGAKIGDILEHVNAQVQTKFEEELEKIHLSDILKGLESREVL